MFHAVQAQGFVHTSQSDLDLGQQSLAPTAMATLLEAKTAKTER